MRPCHRLAVLALAASLAPSIARAGEPDQAAWYDGRVSVDLRIAGGNGAVVQPGDRVALSLRVDHDAYIAVCGIDAGGNVQLLYPRRGDGWVEGGRRIHVQGRDLAGANGVVYIEALASPVRFDFDHAGFTASACESALRVQGDPLVAFNDINRTLLGGWETAAFAVDHAWLYVGRPCEHPSYLCGVCAGRHVGYHDPWARVQAARVWELQRGAGYCRPVFRPLYVYREDRRALRHVREEPSGERSPFPAGSSWRTGREVRRHAPESVHGADVKEVAQRGATQRGAPSDLSHERQRESRAVANGVGPRAREIDVARRLVPPPVPQSEAARSARQRAASGS